MTGKHTEIITRAGEAVTRLAERLVGLRKIRNAAEYLLRALLGFAVSQAVIFGEYSPFGIGYAAASGTSLAGMFGALGVITGYSSLWKMADSLKYAAGTVLTCASIYIFRSLPFSSGKFFAPAAAAASTAFVGFVFVAERGFRFTDIVLYATEIILVFSSAYLYREVLSRTQKETGSELLWQREVANVKSISLFVLIATVLISLNGVSLMAEMSLGRLMSVVFVMYCAFRGGFGMGSAAGVSMGVAFDVVGGGGFYSMSYGFSGLIAGIAGKARRIPTAVAFVLTNAVAALVDEAGSVNTVSLYETFAASVIFMLLPERIMPDPLFLSDTRGRGPIHRDKITSFLRQRISGASRAFRDLHEAVKAAIENTSKKNTQDISKVFDKAAEKVCRGCALKGLCWERDCINTYNVMNDLTPALIEKGRITSNDFPQYFISRCLKPDGLVSAVNAEMKVFLNLRRFRSRINLNRGIVIGQYSELASILKDVAEEVASGIEEDMDAGIRIERLLHDVRDVSVLVWRNSLGRLYVDIEAPDLGPLYDRLEKFVPMLEKVLCKKMGEPEYTSDISGDRIRVKECEPLSVRIGIAAHKRKNSSMSGDCGTYFKTEDGVFYVILSDGMGSGREAAVESGSIVRLLERFIRAGIETESAIRTVNSALMLRNIDEGGFATLDLLEANLFTGEGGLYKCGAAPSFVREGKRVRHVIGKGFPPGTGILPAVADKTRLSFKGGEVIVMLSDGAHLSENDEWICRELMNYTHGSPKELALKIAGSASEKTMGKDDATVVVIEISSRDRPPDI